MAKIPHKVIFKNETLTLTFHEIQKFWLYDKTQGMNLSMRANTEQEAFVESLMYYQKRLQEIKKDYKVLDDKVQNFLSQFEKEEEY